MFKHRATHEPESGLLKNCANFITLGINLAKRLPPEPTKRSATPLIEKADYILDFRETIIPLALLKMSQVVREMKANEVLEIVTRDLDARADVFKVIPGSACELIAMELDKEVGCCRIQLKKRKQSRP
jgi:TusA-related sulfurtransferase